MSQQNDFNIWAKWHPLKKVVVGNCVDPNFFEHVKNIQIREACQRLVRETQDDLDNIAKVLQDLGINVLRTDMEKSVFPTHLNPDKKTPGIKAVMTPRDHYVVLGNHIVGKDLTMMTNKNKLHPEIIPESFNHKNTAWWDLHQRHGVEVSTPDWTIVGKDLFVDVNQNSRVDNTDIRKKITQWGEKWLPNITMHWMDIGGHNDCCFHTCKPGVIISIEDVVKYEESFPGWEVLILPDQGYKAVRPFSILKNKTYGKWWIPGEENNDQLISFINHYLDEWLGFASESIFDVNCLMVNEKTVLVCNYNKEVFDFFKKHKIEPIITPLRHQYFFDSGIHCCTLDLYREGELESYIDYSK